jgi:hypothetical protein
MTKLIRTATPDWTGDVGRVHFDKGLAKVDDDAQELAYFRTAGYGVEDFDDALDATKDAEGPAEADELESLGQQGGTADSDPQVVADVDGDGIEEVLPRRNASAEEWRRFAVEHGLSQDEADAKTRDELVEHFTKETDQ